MGFVASEVKLYVTTVSTVANYQGMLNVCSLKYRQTQFNPFLLDTFVLITT